MLIWIELLFCLAVIGYAGYFLSRYGDIIAEKTGMSASWVGLILLSTATSLPELATGISSVAFADAPNIAVGDVLGSTVFNLAILVMLDGLYKREALYSRAGQGHILSASLGSILIAFAGFSLLLDQAGMSPKFGHVGFYSPFIVLVYLVAIRAVYSYEHRTVAKYTEVSAERYPDVTLRSAVKSYALAAGAVVIAGTWLPFIANDLGRPAGGRDVSAGAGMGDTKRIGALADHGFHRVDPVATRAHHGDTLGKGITVRHRHPFQPGDGYDYHLYFHAPDGDDLRASA